MEMRYSCEAMQLLFVYLAFVGRFASLYIRTLLRSDETITRMRTCVQLVSTALIHEGWDPSAAFLDIYLFIDGIYIGVSFVSGLCLK